MNMIVKNDELKKVMLDSINMLCDAVSSTLGPSGHNVLISNSEISPFITNDGVTIAESIESDDQRINAILEIVKEASMKTNELVGDGTTTTLVLLQSIYTLGLKEIIQGKDSIELKKELNVILNKILEKIDSLKKNASKEDLINIASVSANDKELGEFLTKIYLEIGNTYGIKIEEGTSEKTYYEISNGYNTTINELSNLYFQNNKEIELNNVHILIINDYLSDLESISQVINEGINRNKNILIIAKEYDERIKEEILLLKLQENKNIFLVSISEYGERLESILKDIENITNAKIRNNYDNIIWNDLGYTSKIILKKEELNIINTNDNTSRIIELKEKLDKCSDSYDKEFLNDRISKLNEKRAVVFVGGLTKTEIKEKKMRMIDALCSLNAAKDGVLVGEGITLLKISEELESNNIASKIIKESLKIPFHKIMENAGVSSLEIYDTIQKSNYNLIYNIDTDTFENIHNTKIVDALNVVKESLKNAVSISSMLLTTNYLVINEKEINKNNYYE